MIKGAKFSKDRVYRYALWRTWDEELAHVMFIGLNPSTADGTIDDPTIRRCIGFAREWGYGGVYMLNLFAFRATDPRALKLATDPIGPENDTSLLMYAEGADKVIAAWGNGGRLLNQGYYVNGILNLKLFCLGVTKSKQPRHPLYARGDSLLLAY